MSHSGHASSSHRYERRSGSESPSDLNKPQKTNEKRRRTRERDERASTSIPFPDSALDADMGSQDQELASQDKDSSKWKGGGKGVNLNDLPPDEAAKRARVRTAARERQRKHRAGIKAKRMAQLGMAIVNAGGGVEQTAIGYTVNENGQYEAVLADPSHTHTQQPPVEPPLLIPHPRATPGQIFASTLLLALSCTPRLKQDLLRALHLSQEELTGFEAVVAAVFDQWEYNRSMHYATQGDHPPFASYPPPHSYPDVRNRAHWPLGTAVFESNHHHGTNNSLSPSEDSSHEDRSSEVPLEQEHSQLEPQEPFRPISDLRQNSAHINAHSDRGGSSDGAREEQGAHTLRKIEDEDS